MKKHLIICIIFIFFLSNLEIKTKKLVGSLQRKAKFLKKDLDKLEKTLEEERK